MTCGIYQITNTANNKSYVGLSRNISRRWKQHTGGLNSPNALESGNYPLRADFLKYGLKNIVDKPGKSGLFEFKIIEKCTENKLLERERFLDRENKSSIQSAHLDSSQKKTASKYGTKILDSIS